jgi:hypothetical protein
MTDTESQPYTASKQPNADEYYAVPIPETNYWRKTPASETPMSPNPIKASEEQTPITFQSTSKKIDLKVPPKQSKVSDSPSKLKRDDSTTKMIPKLTKNNSQLSIKVKKQRSRPLHYAKSNEATFHEITRLVGINDEQKVQISKLLQEVKTLKIVLAVNLGQC